MRIKPCKYTHEMLGILLLAPLVLLGPREAAANFMDGIGVGARAMALGSAYTSVADDPFAVYYNVAGLSQMERHAISLGYIYSDDLSMEASSYTSPDFHAEQIVPYHLKCPNIGMVFNLDKTFTSHSPVHLRLGILNLGPDNFKSIYRVWDPPPSVPRWIRYGDYWDRIYLLGGLSIQLDKVPWVAVGLGFNFIISGTNYLVERGGVPGLHLIIRDLQGRVDADGNIDMDVSTRATPTAGLMLFPMKGLRLGYSFRNTLTLPLDPVTAVAYAQLGDMPIGLNVLISMKFEAYYTPQEHNFGASYEFGDKVLLSMDISWFRWSAYTSISRGDPQPRFQDSVIPRLGIEYRPIQPLSLRFGYFFEPSPVPDQIYQSNYIDNDKHVFSLGAGVTFQEPLHIIRFPIQFNLVVQYLQMFERTTVKALDPAGNPYSPTDFESSGDFLTVGADLTLHF